MKILAIDTSSVTVSAALFEDDTLLGETFLHGTRMHSETLMPAVCGLMKTCHASFSEIGLFTVTAGPGSFTGVRIGIAAVKGMALAYGTPCAGISSLEAAAWNAPFFPGIVCAAMDARRGQVYNALFSYENGSLKRRTPDRAISLDDLAKELDGQNVLLLGDGAALCYNALKESCACTAAPDALRYVRAGTVAALGLAAYRAGKAVSAEELLPVYLRLPQAERELRARQKAPLHKKQEGLA